MKFGAVPVKDALGATAVHSIRQGDLVLKKGTLIGDKEVAALQAAGVKEIVVARVEAGDVSEDQAAADIAAAIAGPGPARRPRLHRALQSVRRSRRRAGGRQGRDRQPQPHRRSGDAGDAAGLQAGGRRRDDRDGEDHSFRGGGERARSGGGAAAKAKPVIRIAPYKVRKIGVVSTLLPGLSPKVVEKTLKITATRIAPAGASIIAEKRVPHEQAALAKAIDEVLKAGAELVIVFGASAIADRRDVIPAALEAVGGEIEHFGMPVDPGNLMLIGKARGQAVLGAPGCARSPKENGFDWVLMRLLAGLPVVARTSPAWASAAC